MRHSLGCLPLTARGDGAPVLAGACSWPGDRMRLAGDLRRLWSLIAATRVTYNMLRYEAVHVSV